MNGRAEKALIVAGIVVMTAAVVWLLDLPDLLEQYQRIITYEVYGK